MPEQNIQQNPQVQGQTPDEQKQLKKLLEAHTAVCRARLGREPSLEELSKMLQESAEAQNGAAKSESPEAGEEAAAPPLEEQVEGEPQILKFKVYYGMSDQDGEDGQKTRAADPNKILFYESPDGKVYDCEGGDWLQIRPPFLDHLPSRPLMNDEHGRDIMRAIAHGVMSDEDFAALDKAQLIGDDAKTIFQLRKKASSYQEQLSELNKSEPVEIEPEADDEPSVEQSEPTMVSRFLDLASVVREKAAQSPDAISEAGQNVLIQILEGAFSDVDQKIRDIVRQEVTAQIEPFLAELESLLGSPDGSEVEGLTEPEQPDTTELG
jgi:hypothetical protein